MRLISEESRKRGMSPELFLADLIVQRLDPKERVSVYLKLHEALLRGAEEEYAIWFRPARSSGAQSPHCSMQ